MDAYIPEAQNIVFSWYEVFCPCPSNSRQGTLRPAGPIRDQPFLAFLCARLGFGGEARGPDAIYLIQYLVVSTRNLSTHLLEGNGKTGRVSLLAPESQCNFILAQSEPPPEPEKYPTQALHRTTYRFFCS